MNTYVKNFLFLAILFVSTHNSMAQLNPSASQFYYNQMVQTVAATGIKQISRLDLSFRNNLQNTFNGAPINMYASVQTQFKNGSGVGLQFNGDHAGLLSKNRILGSYALDLSKGDTRIRLGLGLGVMMNRINTKSSLINGDENDPAIANFNQQRAIVDGSVGGLLETKNGWQFVVNVPSLGSIQQFSKYSLINFTTINTLVRKRIFLGDTGNDQNPSISTIEPMVGFRSIHGGKDIIDLGIMMRYQDWIGFMALYHSNNEYAIGVNIPIKNKLEMNFTYNSGKIYAKNYFNVGGTIEAHMMINISKN